MSKIDNSNRALGFSVKSSKGPSVRLPFNLRGLATACVDFGRAQIRTSTQVFHRLATQRKSTQVDRKSTAYARNVRNFATCGKVANPFGHPSQVRTQVLVLRTCVGLASTYTLYSFFCFVNGVQKVVLRRQSNGDLLCNKQRTFC